MHIVPSCSKLYALHDSLLGGELGDCVGGGQGERVVRLHHHQALRAHHAHVQPVVLHLQAHLHHDQLIKCKVGLCNTRGEFDSFKTIN